MGRFNTAVINLNILVIFGLHGDAGETKSKFSTR